MLKVHGNVPSPFARKVRCLLDEKGVAYEIVPLIPFPKTPELLALNPLGQIPILQDGDLVLPDSSVMCAYIERLHPEPSLYPDDPADFARALWLEEYADTKLSAAVGAIFFERFVKKQMMQVEPDEERVANSIENDLPAALAYLEEQIGDRDHLAGDAFSIADAAVCSQLVNLGLGGEPVDAERWPNVARYLATNLARPAFKGILAEEGLA